MITIFLILGLIISLGLNISTFIIIRNLLKRINVYEEWILEAKQDVSDTLDTMREFDKQGMFASAANDKGTFESDDQVGQVFKTLLDLIERLNERIE
jgi:hypothetical protein